MERKRIRTHRDLDVYQLAFRTANQVFEETKTFPTEERYSLTSQIRRSSRSVCANLAEAWRKRRYEAAFVSKLNDVEGEAAETQVWMEFSVACRYLRGERGRELHAAYDSILGQVVTLLTHPEPWLLPGAKRRRR